MKPSAVFQALKGLVVREMPTVFIWGSPGTGKSTVVRELAGELRIGLRDIRALLLDPVDLRGLPFVGKDGRSQWATPDFLPKMEKASCFRRAECRACDGPGQLLSTRAGSQAWRIRLAGRLGNRGCGESGFGSSRDNTHAHAVAEPLCSSGLRG